MESDAIKAPRLELVGEIAIYRQLAEPCSIEINGLVEFKAPRRGPFRARIISKCYEQLN